MSGNGKPPSRTDRARELARYIADQDDEITETHIHVHQPAPLVDRFSAMEITRPDLPRPKQESLTEQVLDAAPELVERVKTREQAWVAVAIVVCLTVVAVVWLVYA